MSVTSLVSTNRKTRRALESNTPPARDTDEFEGIWLNLGFNVADPEDPENEDKMQFVRLPRGVAVSDLQTRKIYDTMDPTFAAQQRKVNSVIEALRTKGLSLEEGESVTVMMEVQLYRRQEATETVETAKEQAAVEEALFG